MFAFLITYTGTPDQIAAARPAHREYLDKFVASGNLLVSGPQNPPVGGLIIAHFPTREAAQAFADNDPFTLQGVGKHQVIEFAAVKYQEFLKPFLGL